MKHQVTFGTFASAVVMRPLHFTFTSLPQDESLLVVTPPLDCLLHVCNNTCYSQCPSLPDNYLSTYSDSCNYATATVLISCMCETVFHNNFLPEFTLSQFIHFLGRLSALMFQPQGRLLSGPLFCVPQGTLALLAGL